MMSSSRSKTVTQFLRITSRALSLSIPPIDTTSIATSMTLRPRTESRRGQIESFCAETLNSSDILSGIDTTRTMLQLPCRSSITVKNHTSQITGPSLQFTKFRWWNKIARRRKLCGKRFSINWWAKPESISRLFKTWATWSRMSSTRSLQTLENNSSSTTHTKRWRLWPICWTSTRNQRWWTVHGILQWQSKWKRARRDNLLRTQMPKASRPTCSVSTTRKTKPCSQTKTTTKSLTLMPQVSLLAAKTSKEEAP